MSYSKANILTLVETLSLDLENATLVDVFYDNVIEQLAEFDNPPFTNNALVELASGTATYNFESAMLHFLYAIMEDASITLTSDPELDAYSKTWRTDTGTPVALTQDLLSRQYTVYPIPDFTSTPLAGGATEPLGEDYPDDNLWIVFSERREASIQDYYALPLALSIMNLEFSHSSDHQDLELAATCAQLAALFLNLLGH